MLKVPAKERMGMAFRFWQELSSPAIAALDGARCVAVLPLAATEQHGPHLPTGTDAIIAEGLIREAAARAGKEPDVVVLPVLDIGASLEHSRFPGTLSLPAGLVIEMIAAVGEGVARAGLRKLILVSAHGGNVAAMTAGALECRVRHGLLAVTLTFARLGLPAGLVQAAEVETGIHGGLIETALLLHFRPDLVDTARAANFPSLQTVLAAGNRRLRAHGPVGFGWLAGDLNPDGVTGNAAAATASVGAAIAAHQGEALLQLLTEVAAADLGAVLNEAGGRHRPAQTRGPEC